MLLSHRREKLLNAIIYFTENTQYCGKVKLFKLLFLLDFEHYREIGRNVTGMDYYAWDMGPVPTSLYQEYDIPKKDFIEHFDIKVLDVGIDKHDMVMLKPKRAFDDSYFSQRELRLLKNIAEENKNKKAGEMIEKTHLPMQPWYRVYTLEGKKDEQIPYHFALTTEELEAMKEIIEESRTIHDIYSPRD